jgi:hypothetical protein
MKNNNLINTIKDLYAIELIFADFRLNNVTLLKEDRLFYIPYKNKRIDLRNNLISITGRKKYKKAYHMICREAEKTLKDNSENIDELINNIIKLLED